MNYFLSRFYKVFLYTLLQSKSDKNFDSVRKKISNFYIQWKIVGKKLPVFDCIVFELEIIFRLKPK